MPENATLPPLTDGEIEKIIKSGWFANNDIGRRLCRDLQAAREALRAFRPLELKGLSEKERNFLTMLDGTQSTAAAQKAVTIALRLAAELAIVTAQRDEVRRRCSQNETIISDIIRIIIEERESAASAPVVDVETLDAGDDE